MKNSACTENNADVPLCMKSEILSIHLFLDERGGEKYLKGQ
jgi:hypothetical protein